jgi:hypothetical protein
MKLLLFVFIQYSFAERCKINVTHTTNPPPETNTTNPPPEIASKSQYVETDTSVWDRLIFENLTSMHSDHSPATVPDSYESSKAIWDGTKVDISNMSREEELNALCPTGDVLKGIEELYEKTKPFKDTANPTMAEVDAWNVAVVLHFRSMLNIAEVPPFKLNKCHSGQALISQEYVLTDKYGDHSKICQGVAHCGYTFSLSQVSPEQKKQYYPSGSCADNLSAWEGIMWSPPDLNWVWRIPRSICGTISYEGVKGGHTSLYIQHTEAGFSFAQNGQLTVHAGGERICDPKVFCCDCKYNTDGSYKTK